MKTISVFILVAITGGSYAFTTRHATLRSQSIDVIELAPAIGERNEIAQFIR